MKKRAKRHKNLEKELLSMEMQLKDLLVEDRKLPLKRIKKPKIIGYKKSFTLKNEYLSADNVQELLQVLSIVNDTTYCPHMIFETYPYYNKMIHEPRFRMIDYIQFDKLPENLKKYFILDAEIDTFNHFWKYYRLKNKNCYRKSVTPYVLTHMPVRSLSLKHSRKQLYNDAEKLKIINNLNHLKGIATKHGNNKKNNIRNKFYLTDKYMRKFIYDFLYTQE